jgi:hypothetical protein
MMDKQSIENFTGSYVYLNVIHTSTIRYYFLLTFIFGTAFCFGQMATVKKIEQINPVSKEKYVFPKIIVQGMPVSSKKINNKLRSEILDVDSAVKDSQIFNGVWRTAEQWPTLSDLAYEVIRNDRWVLSIKISAEGCGAYCENWERYFTFNLKTGNQLFLDSLINDIGLHKLATDFNSFKQAKLRNIIKETKDTLETTAVKNDKETLEYFSDMLSLYTGCLDSKIEFEDMTGMEFSVESPGLVLYSERCSVHYNRNLDELWIFEYKIDLKDWKGYLTNYGRYFFTK